MDGATHTSVSEIPARGYSFLRPIARHSRAYPESKRSLSRAFISGRATILCTTLWSESTKKKTPRSEDRGFELRSLLNSSL